MRLDPDAMRARLAMPALLLATATTPACTGLFGDLTGEGDDTGGSVEDALLCGGDTIQATHVPLRRLTPEQFNNTIRDLTGDLTFEAELEPADGAITERAVRQLRDAAELVLTRRDQWTLEVIPCSPETADLACAESMIADFGERAFRRPVTEAERAWLTGVYQTAAAEVSPAEAIDVTLQVILQAHPFVYLYEGASTEDAVGSVRVLTDHEVATRLSYFLWNTTPDRELLDAANAGQLRDTDGLRAQAERMLADPRAEPGLQRFVSSWMQLDGGKLHHSLEEATKDAELYPEHGPELAEAMRRETEALVRRTFFEEEEGFEQLFTATYAYVNGPLAEVYGVDGPSDAETFEWVELDASRRAGLITRAAFLTVYSNANVTSPIRRGVWVVEDMLCQHLGEPPPNANDTKVAGGEVENENGEIEVMTVREEVELRTMDGTCAGCHAIINPVGFTFENYDGIGRWQTEELTSGLPIDSSADLVNTGVDGTYANAVELSKELAQSDKVKGCFVRNWFRRALETNPDAIDQCSLDHAQDRLNETGSMREMVIAIVESNAFRYLDTAGE